MLTVKRFVFNPFDENTYLLTDSATGQTAVVDPGMFNVHDLEEFDNYIEQNRLTLTQIINTHLHVDHCFGNTHVRDRYGIKTAAHPGDAELGRNAAAQAARFGMRRPMLPVTIDVPLADGDTITIGSDNTLTVIAVPGHSQGGIALYDARDGFVLTGDSLFQNSIGRTDLPGGNMRQLVQAVRTRLLTLPDDTVVLPGHGPATTIGQEKAGNPFL